MLPVATNGSRDVTLNLNVAVLVLAGTTEQQVQEAVKELQQQYGKKRVAVSVLGLPSYDL